ncbi:hypothetical protein GGTG_13455 [Gaeumannomyces tritici R3-111a-1]|uniref:Uncharacterized protein n=1 Tax=Gaeumannomyces tritici (strain R3-111a-1) TaxID=644352 RepID=J3PIX5_GAET3|nr:hypothetical protein GGTG_13455 [Gaeumannomyces tritici R3-111a-1]EJT68949.1 hypothetical protein GGTG_13455 [Gaeumannomyces tritici R3-111a-1]
MSMDVWRSIASYVINGMPISIGGTRKVPVKSLLSWRHSGLVIGAGPSIAGIIAALPVPAFPACFSLE